MICSKHVRLLLLITVAMLPCDSARSAARVQDSSSVQTAMIHLRWVAQPGVSRYRLQLARDKSFDDIVVDRLVTGNEAHLDDLLPGKYFWRIAPLTAKLGAFSSSAVIEVRPPEPVNPQVDTQSKPPTVVASPIVAGGGWRAVVGDISQPVLAHLRSPEKFDVVGTNSDGVTFALDAASGVALWTVRLQSGAARDFSINAPLIIPTRARIANVVVFGGARLAKFEGLTGHELWRSNLPAAISSGAAISDRNASRLIFVDSSLQRLIIVDEMDGRVIAQIALPARVIGAPVSLRDEIGFMLAYDTGRIEIRDRAGAIVRSGDVASSPTTAPIFIRGASGNLILVGTRDGLTAMTAGELRTLGRVAIKGDVPRGTLMAQDLDGDGVAEVIMTTVRGHVIAINATDGRIVWDVTADTDGGAFAFADLNGDHVLDVITGGQAFAVALSGKDGLTIWKDAGPLSPIGDHSTTVASRSILAAPFGAGAILIASEPAHNGLRAIVFPKAEIRPSPR